MRLTAIAAAAALAATAGAARAEPASSQIKAAAFMETVATRGLECGLLRPWQASAIRALTLTDLDRRTPAQRAEFAPELDRSLAERSCDDEGVQAWVDAASRGFESEMLAPYLVVYRALAASPAPPKLFTQTATRLQFAPAIAAIDAKLDALAASGLPAEGGKPWPDYIAGVEAAVLDLTAALDDPDAPPAKRREAAVMAAQSAHIVELWLLDDGPSPPVEQP
ncbi:MAG: hypothetical protein AAGC56_13100 [Pseudomonadota bacterium]